uniref:Uncharacterized protein n=1 Tax=Arundo donax TaxID=35708 RepID=A0A0A9FFY6_ARUDO
MLALGIALCLKSPK